MSVTTKIVMPVRSFRRIENPFEKDGKRMYLAVIKACDLASEFEEWREINPRDPKTTSGVAQKISSTLREDPESFFFKNRGITILVKTAAFDNENNELAVELADRSIHGLLDGGHTFAVIREAFESLTDEEKTTSIMNEAYVKLEILEGFPSRSEAVEIVGARNASTQVKDQSLDNLLQRFDTIKQVLSSKQYANRIAYKETEFNDEGAKKDIDIKEILSYLICFDREGFDDSFHPVIAYSSKASVLKYADNNYDRLQKYIPILPDILELRDRIYEKMPEAWNRQGGKFGRIESVGRYNRPVYLPFSGRKTEYSIPSAFIYPVLAAFRSLAQVKNGECSWIMPPIEFFERHQQEIVRRLVDQALVFRNPTKLGKEKTVWQTCYDYIAMEVLKSQLKK